MYLSYSYPQNKLSIVTATDLLSRQKIMLGTPSLNLEFKHDKVLIINITIRIKKLNIQNIYHLILNYVSQGSKKNTAKLEKTKYGWLF
jgi:hypothetical protein